MIYYIRDIAKRFDLSPYTIRFYDREGLFPTLRRDSVGRRIFTDEDLDNLSLILCLKNTGMSLKDIRKFVALCQIRDVTLEQRLQILLEQKNNVLRQISELQGYLPKLEDKIACYQEVYEKTIKEGILQQHVSL